MFRTALQQSIPILAIAISGLANASAEPLDKSRVAADAKWVVHLDFDAFRKSKVGAHIVANFLEPKIKNSGMKEASINLTNVSAVTAYGTDFEKKGEGVLLVSTSADVKGDLDKLVKKSSEAEEDEKRVTQVEQGPVPIYQVKGDLLVAPLKEGVVVAAKSREQLDLARELLSGKGKSLAKADAFKVFPEVADSFFFLGMAEGFNETAEIPAEAQVLRETDGGRLVMGEKDKSLFINLVFRGKDEESTTKIQQVLQGIVALVSMTQKDSDATELASSAKISGEGRNVSVTLSFPTVKAIERIDKHVQLNMHEDEVGVEVKFNNEEEEESEGAGTN